MQKLTSGHLVSQKFGKKKKHSSFEHVHNKGRIFQKENGIKCNTIF